MDPSKFEALLKKAYENQNSSKTKRGRPKKAKKSAIKEITKAKPKKRYENITVEEVDKLYERTQFKPMQDNIFFIENDNRMHSDLIDDEGVCATPVGAMVFEKKQAIAPEDETIFTTLFDEPSHCWTLGSIAQLLGYPCGYIQGFERGFNNYSEPHPNSGKDCHEGFLDGKRVLDAYIARDLIEIDPDPFEDEEDPAILKELHRCTGYWREEWDDCPPWLINYYDDEADIPDTIFTEADAHNV